jgi:hypothetical protein
MLGYRFRETEESRALPPHHDSHAKASEIIGLALAAALHGDKPEISI